MKRFISAFILLLFSVFFVTAEETNFLTDDLVTFEQAKNFFEEQDYGKALKFFNKAKLLRTERIKSEVRTLENAYKPAEVKYAGSLISQTRPVIEKREDFDALKIISKYLKIHGLEFFEDSPVNLINFIRRQANYPEADFFIGKIYMVEGEYSIAEKYFKTAYEFSDVLEIADEKYEILSSLVELNQILDQSEKIEEYLLLIVSKDSFYKDRSKLDAVMKIISKSGKKSLENFFKMFRSYEFDILDTYFKLTEFYEAHDEEKKALEANAVGVITGFTKIFDVVKKRNPEFEYENFPQMMDEVCLYSDIIEWGINNNLWASFNKLAALAAKNGDIIFAVELYNALKDKNPEEYWRNEAAVKLQDFTLTQE